MDERTYKAGVECAIKLCFLKLLLNEISEKNGPFRKRETTQLEDDRLSFIESVH